MCVILKLFNNNRLQVNYGLEFHIDLRSQTELKPVTQKHS